MKTANIKSVNGVEKKEVSKTRQFMANLWLVVCMVMIPEIAMANPISDGVDWVLDLLTNGIARSLIMPMGTKLNSNHIKRFKCITQQQFFTFSINPSTLKMLGIPGIANF